MNGCTEVATKVQVVAEIAHLVDRPPSGFADIAHLLLLREILRMVKQKWKDDNKFVNRH